MSRAPIRTVLFGLALSCGVGNAIAGQGETPSADGKVILEKNCARCHAVGAEGASPLGKAPPFREVFKGYPVERLEFELSEGIGSRHPDMPQIQFSAEEIAAIVEYLGGLTGGE